MRKNNRVVPWFTGSGSILTLAGAVMLMLAWGCSKSADTPPEKPPAAPAASPEAGAPQTAVETPAPQPAAAPATPPAAGNVSPPAAAPTPPPAANVPPPAAPTAGNAPGASAVRPDSEEARRLIEEKLAQLQSAGAKPAPGQAVTPPPSAGAPSVPASGAQAAPQPLPPPPAPAAGEQKPGRTPILDGESLDMAPPPPDQPQPRAVYDRELIVADPIWRGESAKFLFNVRNEGEGVLNMNMKACCGLSINGVRNGWPGWSLRPGVVRNIRDDVWAECPWRFHALFAAAYERSPKPEDQLHLEGAGTGRV